ncbi:hypothetical protein Galf_2575 [Gallionella capsiferriformans ES-2]|uniref:Uncharacterized protein n=1 Tax=Gallionella capsiferriformans (strain ES-2) TaxID=395494 RepID=D9SCJ2_GALCS|nr:hypothetical protein Galf_2575 [Gallionella capsiferriformans ES-2]
MTQRLLAILLLNLIHGNCNAQSLEFKGTPSIHLLFY